MTTAELESSLVVLDLSSNTYFRLNEVGAAIWQKIENGNDEGDIIGDLSDRFGADRAVVADDVRRFVQDLEAAGLITSGRDGSRR